MHKAIALSAVIWASCSLFEEANPNYCTSDGQCPNPMVCNLQKHACEVLEVLPDDPVITSISPPAAGGQGGMKVTITGRNFDRVIQVLFAGVAGTNLNIVSSTQLGITVPAGSGLCGLVTVTLKTSDGRTARDSTKFRYRATNVDFPVSRMSVAQLNASPVTLLNNRHSGGGYDDLLIGYAQPTLSMSYAEISGQGRLLNETYFLSGGPTPFDVTKLALARILPGNGPSILIGNRRDRISMYTTALSDPKSIMPVSQMITLGSYVDFNVGDFNNDGKADLVVLNSTTAGSTIAIYYSDGAGAYSTSSAGGMITAMETTGFAVGDMNRDGFDDVVLATNSSVVVVAANNKVGGFEISTNFPSASTMNRVAVADMDVDGIPDVVVYGMGLASGPAVSLLYNSGNIGFNAFNLDVITGRAIQLVFGDIDCDALPDLTVFDGSGVVFYSNQGVRGQFGAGVSLGQHLIQSMSIGLFNEDNLNDLALLQAKCPEAMPGMGCLRILGNGSN